VWFVRITDTVTASCCLHTGNSSLLLLVLGSLTVYANSNDQLIVTALQQSGALLSCNNNNNVVFNPVIFNIESKNDNNKTFSRVDQFNRIITPLVGQQEDVKFCEKLCHSSF